MAHENLDLVQPWDQTTVGLGEAGPKSKLMGQIGNSIFQIQALYKVRFVPAIMIQARP